MLRRWLCGLTPWTRHEYVIGRRMILLFEVTCAVCGYHAWGHQDFLPLLPWRVQDEVRFQAFADRALGGQLGGSAGEG